MESTKVLESPVKSSNDKKDYRVVQLANGLKVILIKSAKVESSNENGESNENLAAVALCIGIGSFDDPRTVPGLSHFLEHMIFMGSEKYPLENEYLQFLKSNGGDANALTEYEYTVYFFNVVENKLPESLDRFAQLFISPLMLRDSMQREREAVDSEFHNVYNQDQVRYQSFIVSLMNDNQRGNVFDWGNLKSLKDDISDEDLFKTVHDFRKKYYVAKRMYLGIQSSSDLDDMQQMIETYFSPIETGEDEPIYETDHQTIFKPEFSEKIYFLKPIMNTTKLSLTWVLPAVDKHYRCRPLQYLQFLMEYSGKGGLSTYLRKSLLATAVDAEVNEKSFSDNAMFSLFRLEVSLTEAGFKNINKVLEAIFSYLLLLKTAPMEKHRQLYEEIQQLKQSTFKYSKEADGADTVTNAVVLMKYYESKEILTGDLYLEFNEDLITSMIDKINLRTFNMVLLTNQHNVYDKKEKWFDTEYAEEDFPQSYTQLWNDRELSPEKFHFPDPNPFISTNFDIYVNCRSCESTKHPVQVLKTDVCEVWHKLDENFKLPFVHIIIYLISPKKMSSAFNTCMTNMYVNLFNHYAIENLAPAYFAGQSCSLSESSKGIMISVNGFSSKIQLMVDEVTSVIKNIVENVEESVFDLMKAEGKKNYFNILMKGSRTVDNFLNVILEEKCTSNYERYLTVDTLKFEDFKKFAGKFLKNLKIQMLAQGNITKKQSMQYAELISSILECNPIDDLSTGEYRIRELPAGTNYLKMKSFLAIDETSTILNYYQLGETTIRKACLLKLLSSIMTGPIFNILRNQEQLGYSVNCYTRDNWGILGFEIDITSQEKKHPVDVVNDRIEKFLQETFKIQLDEMTDEVFKTFIDSQINLKTAKEIDLVIEYKRNWNEIVRERLIFDRREQQAEMFKTFTKSDFIEFYESEILSPNARKLSVQIIGKSENNIDETSNLIEEDNSVTLKLVTEKSGDHNEKIIQDITEFKNTLSLYPID